MNLKPVEIGILALSPYSGAQWTGEDQRIAHRLVKRGFLECDMTNPSFFRSTPAGSEQLRKLVSGHVA